MAQLLAPYHNGMRLGQGFNSYTQQICLDHAVLKDIPQNRRLLAPEATKYLDHSPGKVLPGSSKSDETDEIDTPTGSHMVDEDDEDEEETTRVLASPKAPPWVKSQIVTYSSRFVDKISDVTDAMNISGSLSIKTQTIGGKASGSYVDSDKFKESDINFHLQVKVTNQIVDGSSEYTLFNQIEKVGDSDFVSVYGDCFISGWEEGGELNAVMSMKVNDKSKIFEVKAHLEASLSVAAVDGKVDADVKMAKNSLSRNCETTIAVNWSGGGSIKDPKKDWNIDTLKEAAAAFPDLVAMTPQRVYAILTKYQHLETFQRLTNKISLIDYENATIYTNSLLDHFMDYKVMWKQLAQATFELENRRATIEMAKPKQDIVDEAHVTELPLDQIGVNLNQTGIQVGASTSSMDVAKQPAQHESSKSHSHGQGSRRALPKKFSPYAGNFAGLIAARKACRVEMAKIVNEVDLIARDPRKAIDPTREGYFLHPLIFKMLLPVVRGWATGMKSGATSAQAPLILGYEAPQPPKTLPPILQWNKADPPAISIAKSVDDVKEKAEDYRLLGGEGNIFKELSVGELAFNDLQLLDPTYRPVTFNFWSPDAPNERVLGIEVLYANGQRIRHGLAKTLASQMPPTQTPASEAPASEVPASQIPASKVEPTQVPPTHTFHLDESESVFEIVVSTKHLKSNDKDIYVSSIKMITTHFRTFDTKVMAGSPKLPAANTPQPLDLVSENVHCYSVVDERSWSLRGFFGIETDKTIVALGLVVGKSDFVPVPIASTVPHVFFGTSFDFTTPALQKSIPASVVSKPALRPRAAQELLSRSVLLRPEIANKFRFGACLSLGGAEATNIPFNFLTDLGIDWKIKEIFFYSQNKALRELQVVYTNGKALTSGSLSGNSTWNWPIKQDLVTVKIASATDSSVSPSVKRIQSLEFVCADKDGLPNPWPTEASMIRYLGEANIPKDAWDSSIIQAAPNKDGVRWSIRGFYGESKSNVICSLGVIWGCG